MTSKQNLKIKFFFFLQYYFGDINLPKDKFMLEQIKLDEGWIPMSTMLKFQRLAKLSSDPKVIAEALHKSQLMEVSVMFIQNLIILLLVLLNCIFYVLYR